MTPVFAQIQAGSTSSIPWTTIIIIIAVIVVLVALAIGLVIWWRKRNRKKPVRSDGAPLDDKLEGIYRPFYRDLPLAAHVYPTVIVAGAAGAGKSHLIDRHVDWRGQARQFHPSRTDQSLMQLYLGPGVIVQELSAPLLRDVSREAEHGLSKLWQRLGRRSASVVVVIKATELAMSSPQSLAELAQLIRGKLDLISDYGNRSISVRLCLSHLDQVEGYSGFSRLLRSRNHTTRVDPTGGQLVISDLDGALVPFDSHLALALTTCSPTDFREIVDFYDQSPALFNALSPFLHQLRGGDDPFAREYPIEGMYFGSANPDEFVGNPFEVDRSTVVPELSSARKRHLAICAAIFMVAVFGLGILFGWHEARLSDAETAVAGFHDLAKREDTSPRALSTAQERAHRALGALEDSNILWLAGAFEERKQTLAEDYRDSLRQAYLLPIIDSTAERGKLLYAASLIYAARHNEIGEHIDANPGQWMSELSLSKTVVRDYVNASASPWDGQLELPVIEDGSDSAWANFLRQLEDDIGGDRISAKRLQARKDMLNNELRLGTAARYQALDELSALIAQDADLRARLAPLLAAQTTTEWFSQNYDALAGVTDLVERGSLNGVPKDVSAWNLAQLLDELRRIAKLEKPAVEADSGTTSSNQPSADSSSAGSAQADAGISSDPAAPASATETASTPMVYSFPISGKTIEISADGWQKLLVRSRAGMLIDRFIAQVDTDERSPFFAQGAYYPAAGAMRGTTRGPTGVIPGLYTLRAFKDAVLPVLTDMSQGLGDIALAKSDRESLDSYVQLHAGTYASEYGQEIDSYYRSFAFDSATLDELIFELQAMSRASGWFVSYLRTVAHNADLQLPGTGPFFDPMAQAVEPFQSFVALMTEANGAYPQLDPYLKILSDLATALEGTGASAEPAEGLELDTSGQLALPVVQGNEKPVTTQVRAFLATAAIDSSYHFPFLIPVERVYQLGYSDIERAVAQAWQTVFMNELQPLLDKFPFARSARENATAADIEEWFLPATGRFWQEFAVYIEPVAEKQRGRWRMRSPIRAPKGMLTTINRSATLSATLWDEKGNRQLLAISLTPKPLPTDQVDGRVSVLAYIKCGSSIIYGFNQKPKARELEIEWWSEATSSVGVRLQAPEETNSQSGSVDVVESLWSFHRLLRIVQATKEGEVVWKVPVQSSTKKSRTLNVPVILNDNPFVLFTLE